MSNVDRSNVDRALGLNKFKVTAECCCFLPFIGEFGWYIMTYVKRFHYFDHQNKMVCCKPGHECLFPTASGYYYDWQDVSDSCKAGILQNEKEDEIKAGILSFNLKHMNYADTHFVSPSEVSWDEKASLAAFNFIPQARKDHSISADIVIAPRNRTIDAQRNWTKDKWQTVVDALVAKGITVAICGTKETSFDLNGVSHRSWDYIDVDTDVELMNKAKLVIVQESGLAYLSYLCKRPTILMDHPHEIGALHRNPDVFYKNVNAWSNPQLLIDAIVAFLHQ